jgi:RHS repeat-associated protein
MTDASPAAGVGGSGALGRVFEYDALYRLVMATGRESGQFSNSSTPWNEGYYVPDNSPTATRHYTRSYEYDRLGNMLHLHHNAGVGNTFHRWFNDFNNNSTAFQASNLATEIAFGGTTVSYVFDACGNMVSEGTGRAFGWDYGDRMRGFAEGGVRAAYIYDGGGNRVKKLVTKSGANTEVTVYIDGGFEYIYEIDGSGAVTEEFNELHVMDGRSRVARVKIFGATWSGSVADGIRYNLEDHLGNAGFTLDATGSLINREEYFPFGETSFGSYAKKRYRFCGKERDEESGLYYYGARYYACWSCRFVSIDPLAGEMPFASPYSYAANNPVALVDVDGLAPGDGNEQKAESATNESGQQPAEASNSATGGGDARAEPRKYEGQKTIVTHQVMVTRTQGKSEAPYRVPVTVEEEWIWHAGTETNNYQDFKWMPKADYQNLVYHKVLEKTDFVECNNPWAGKCAVPPANSALGIRTPSGTGTAFFEAYDNAVKRVKQPESDRSEGLDDRGVDMMMGVELSYGILKGSYALARLGCNEAASWWASRVIGTAQLTGTRGHAFFSNFVAFRYAIDPRVERVTLDLGFKKLLGEPIAKFRFGPRPDVGVLWKSGRVTALELVSKSQTKAAMIAKNYSFMTKNMIIGNANAYSWPKTLNKFFPLRK